MFEYSSTHERLPLMQVTLYTWGFVAAMYLLVAPPSGFKLLCHVSQIYCI